MSVYTWSLSSHFTLKEILSSINLALALIVPELFILLIADFCILNSLEKLSSSDWLDQNLQNSSAIDWLSVIKEFGLVIDSIVCVECDNLSPQNVLIFCHIFLVGDCGLISEVYFDVDLPLAILYSLLNFAFAFL